MKWIIASGLWLIYCYSSLAQPQFVQVDGVKIRVNTIGIEERKTGEPLLIFESGAGTPMGNWDKIIADSLNLGAILAYDRPGIGESEAVDEIPTPVNVANRLVRLLHYLKLEPPYILVGHSLGGIYVRGFAVYYPHKLAGLVIVDPGDFTETQLNKRDYYEVLDWNDDQIDQHIQMEIENRATRRVNAPPAIQREGQALEAMRLKNFDAIQSTPLPNIPVHIIVGGKFGKPVEKQSKEYDEERYFRSKLKHRVSRWTDVIQSVERGMLLYSGDAGHFVQWEDPELVITSIKLVLKDYADMVKKQ
ncbi:MAG: alpha/beta hydrolase [Cytophagales bacterium]|nr:alpha/beta hydrolase [Cytophagales bacterium]